MRKLTYFVVLLGALGLLALLRETLQLQQEIQQATHAAVVSAMRAELMESWVRLQVASSSLEPGNPVRWLRHAPQAYLGEFRQPPPQVQTAWFYDLSQDCLVYVFAGGEKAAYRLKTTAGLSGAARGVIGGVDLVKDASCNE